MMADTDSPKSKKPRKLSRFLCQEMLYDYATGHLEPVRKKSVEDHLESTPDTAEELESLNQALSYCDKLSETKISEALYSSIKEHKPVWGLLFERLDWRRWPEPVRWGSEAFVISVFVAFIAMMIPWDKFDGLLPKNERPVTLAELDSPESIDLTGAPSRSEPGSATASSDAEAVDGEVDGSDEVGPSQPPAQVVASPPAPKPKTAMTSERAGKKGSRKESATAIAGLQTEDAAKVVASSKSKKAKVKVKAGAKPLKGEVFRAFMNIGDVDNVTPQIVAEIERLGGVKAGKVSLGWRKPKGSYFHFSLDKVHHDELLETLRNFGPVRIYKDPHWRVMPEGKIRFILWVESSKAKQ